ncbi:acyl-CoA dehydrogenase family protein [Cupriavidus sp. NPDC089707]|uniref:acyl-CoA dehydrogenase family protein n=1 Tax=Cupriavidus sp. NPDC089707 TaxID=3363963 RepID=UPI003811FCAF
MNELEQMLADSAEKLFGREVTTALIEAAEQGEWPRALWNTVEESGLPRLFADEEQGGADASWQDALPALLQASRSLAPIPFIETAVCGWLLQRLGLRMPEGPLGLADLDAEVTARRAGDGWRLDGTVGVPWGRQVSHVLIRARSGSESVWLLLPTAGCMVEQDVNLAREPRDRLTFADTAAVAAVQDCPLGSASAAKALGAVMRAIQMAGVLERVLDQTVRYANERIQFGRPIGKFQAIQQQLAVLANEVVAARMAVSSACAAMATSQWEQQAMVSKVICGQAAGRVAAIAHQVHGAIGFTYEHDLHFSTRRLWAWRAEYGSETCWAREIGERAIRLGGTALWADVTGTLPA